MEFTQQEFEVLEYCVDAEIEQCEKTGYIEDITTLKQLSKKLAKIVLQTPEMPYK